MKKIACLALLALSATLLFAETVFWVGPDPIDDDWTNGDLFAFTDIYTEGSTVSVTSEYGTVTAVVRGKLPETVAGRDMALTEKGLVELGLWGQGHTVVSVKLKSGSMVDEAPSCTDSGWYELRLGAMDSKVAFEAYTALSRKGLKPRAEVVDGKVVVVIANVVAYEKDDVISTIKAAGYEVAEAKEAPNPYL